MFWNKVLSNSRHLLSKNVAPVKAAGMAVRQRHAVAISAKNPISMTEKIVLAGVLSVTMWFVPLWVLYYIPEYQQENRHEYTGK